MAISDDGPELGWGILNTESRVTHITSGEDIGPPYGRLAVSVCARPVVSIDDSPPLNRLCESCLSISQGRRP